MVDGTNTCRHLHQERCAMLRQTPTVLASLGLGVVVGCGTVSPRPHAADPILGVPAAPAPTTSPTTAAPFDPAKRSPYAQQQVPTTTNTASLASTLTKPLDGGAELRIRQPIGDQAPMPTTVAQQPGQWGTAPPVTLQPPVAAETPAPTTTQATHSAQASERITSLEQALLRLRAAGVRGQRWEQFDDNGPWYFSCTVPNAANTAQRRYEAHDRDLLTAVLLVLEQICAETTR
jgi:hypothetical protein